MGNAKRGIGAKSLAWTLLIGSTALALSGCGGDSGSAATSTAAATTTADTTTSTLAGSGTSSSSSSSAASSSSSASTSSSSSSVASSGASSSSSSSSAGGTPSSSPTVTLSWQVPTERADGTPLTNLAGYNIHYGPASENYTNTIKVSNAGLTAYVVDNLAAGTYYFSISAYDSTGLESALSGEASAVVN